MEVSPIKGGPLREEWQASQGVLISNGYGALAQLGERYNGIVEVSGSIPLGSTILRYADFRLMPGCKWRVPALPVLTDLKSAPLRFSEPTIFASA